MADRIDVLGDTRGRLKAFTGAILEREFDAELQECVAVAAQETGAPIALVSLVLERTQFFRAQHGLPKDLAVSRATDRDLSFCQFVVRDESLFEVNDATTDQRVPQDLVERYNVKAYLGVPVVANRQVVGSLCVIDTVARKFSEQERSALIELGKRASERLQFLADVRKKRNTGTEDLEGTESLLTKGLEPAFSEIRNLLVPMTAGIEFAHLTARELAPIAAVMSSDLSEAEILRSLGALRNVGSSITELEKQLEEISQASTRLVKTLTALQAVTVAKEPSSDLESIIGNGLELAHHFTKLIGGVVVDDIPQATIGCSLSIGASLLSAVATILSSLIEGMETPIHLSVEKTASTANVALTTSHPLDRGQLSDVAAKVASFAVDTSSVLLTASTNGFRISLALVGRASRDTVSGYF